jgi:glycosyltransferase involved in cell wall biosynthesis
MRIIHYIPWLYYGGCERSVLNLCTCNEEAVSSIFTRDPGPFTREFQNRGFRVWDASTPVSELDKLMCSVDLVHIHGMYPDEVQGGIDFALQYCLPHLVTLRSRAVLPKLSCHLVCVSQSIRDMQHPENACSVIANGVNLELFQYRPPRQRGEAGLVLTRVCRPGRCAPQFIEAMNLVASSLSPVEVWVVGEDGTSTGIIKYWGLRSDVPDLLANSDLFVYYPVPDFSAHDNCVLEAMAIGLPVVATDVVGVRESIEDGISGKLVPFGRAEDFAHVVISLLRDHDKRKQLGVAARRSVEERFSMAQVCRSYNVLYKRLIGS